MKFIGTKTLETDRLILRKITVNDAKEAYDNWCSSFNVSKYVVWNVHKNVEETKKLFKTWEDDYDNLKTYRWIVEIKDTHELIGTIDVVNKNLMEFGVCEIGYCYGEKFWGKGYGTEALSRVIEFLFEECDVDVIYVDHLEHNPASGKVMVKSGLIYEATLKGRYLDKNGIRNNLITYSLTKEEYLNNKNRMKKKELLNLIDNLGIDLSECAILSTSALVIRDLYPTAGDLDIAVTDKGLEQLKSKYNLKQKENGWYIVNDKVECINDNEYAKIVDKHGKYNLESLEKYFTFLKQSDRKKDIIKYDIVRKELCK